MFKKFGETNAFIIINIDKELLYYLKCQNNDSILG